MVIRFILNDKLIESDLPEGMLLLDYIRYHQRLTGTKIGCREGDCGACTVLTGELIEGKLRYRTVTSCLMPMGNAHGKHIVTIEGLSENNDHPLQQAWQQIDVPQCGYCHSGQLMSAAVLLRENPHPGDQDIDDAMAGNLCRCGTYLRVRKAIHLAAEIQAKNK